MKILISEKLSEHKYKTPEGYLVCVDSILARTGKQTYRRNELFHDGDDTEVEVDRTPEEVFSEATLASFENKPVTVEHPDEDVNINNYKEYAVGFVRDVKRGEVDGQDVILGTLVITDAQTIEEIENGEHTELSCGYDCDILDEDNPTQRNIRGNHVALCEQGRAGIAKIVDSVKDAMYCVEFSENGQVFKTWIEARDEKEAQALALHSNPKAKIRNVYRDSVDDAKNRLPAKDRKFILNYLRMISTYTSRDVDIRDLLRPLSGHGFNYTIDKIEGWIWKTGHYAYKNYYVSINGYDDRFLVTLYADPNQDWKVKEVNAYFTDSVNDSVRKTLKSKNGIELKSNGDDYEIWVNGRIDSSFYDSYKEALKEFNKLVKRSSTDSIDDNINDDQHIELVKGNHERDQILAVYQSDIDENLYFYVGKKYCMKDGAFSYNKYLIKSSPQAIMRELEKNGWHKVNRGPAPFIDSVNDSTYKCEFNLNEDTMWTYVKADSPEDAKREILDKFANAKNISVTGHDSVDDAVDLVFKDFVFAVEQCLRKAFYKLPPIHEHQWSNSVEIPFDYSQKNWIPSSASIKNFLKNEYGFNVKVSRVTSNWAYEKEIIMTITLISKVSKDSVDDASRGHEIVRLTENYLSELGKNNSIGKYDKIIRGVKYRLEQGFLQGEELKKAVRNETDKLLKAHGLDSAMKVVNMIKAKDSEIDNAKRILSNKGINVAKVTGSEAAFYLWLENKDQSKQALDILKQIYKDVNVYTDDKTKMKKK